MIRPSILWLLPLGCGGAMPIVNDGSPPPGPGDAHPAALDSKGGSEKLDGPGADRGLDSGSADGPPPATGADPFESLPKGAAQHMALCARKYGDSVSKAFCANPTTPPRVASLVELQKLVGLDLDDTAHTVFSINTHSESLVVRYASPLLPRTVIHTRPLPVVGNSEPQDIGFKPNPTFVAMTFSRGEQFAELVSKDTDAKKTFRFFLFKFEQACNKAPGGCTHGDLMTEDIEHNFTGYTLYDDSDLANNQFDCLQCHQPQGPGTPRLLRMQELQPPWLHWPNAEQAGGITLCNEFRTAHSGLNESFAGVPLSRFDNNTCNDTAPGAPGSPLPRQLQLFVQHNNNGMDTQPNEFDSGKILQEIKASSAGQPDVNVPPGTSATWRQLYDNYLAGGVIPPPYHDVRITDSAKMAKMVAAFRAVMTGAMPRAQLPDIRDVFLDAALPDMTIRPRSGSSGRAILVQMCQQCHNSRLDQTISRARFNVETLDQLGRAEKDTAISRVSLPKAMARHMPPDRFRELSTQEIQLVKQELMK